MNNQIKNDPIEDLLRQAEAMRAAPEPDPAMLKRIVDQGLEEFDRQQSRKQKQSGGSSVGWDIRRYLPQMAAAALVMLAVGFWLLSPSKTAQAKPSFFKSTDGLSHAQIRALFPNFAALRDAPDDLPTGSIAEPGEIKNGQWPSFAGFDVLSDSKLYDMTWWRPLDAQQIESGRNSPVGFTRSLLLRRNHNVPKVNELTFKFSTTGFAVDPVKLKPTDKVITIPDKELSARNGGRLEKAFFLITDVSDKPDDRPFTLVIHAVYWNGFNHGSVEDASTALATTGGGSNADLGVLFPPHNYFAKKWSLYQTPIVNGKLVDKTAANVFAAGHVPELEPGILYWPIAEPQPSSRYTLEWTWAAQGDKK